MLKHFFHIIIVYKYQILFPIALLEGPIISIISGLFIALGYLSLVPTFLILFSGDFISDNFYFLIGRYSHKLNNNKFQFFKNKYKAQHLVHIIQNKYYQHPIQTIALGKIVYGLGSFFMIAAGVSHMHYLKFLRSIIIFNFLRSTVFLIMGYFFGRVILPLHSSWKYYVIGISIIITIIYFVFSKKKVININ
ncbi:MAG: DedA family protein [Minisyncoccia bacterium]